MSIEPALLAFGLVVGAAYAVQTMIGFGSMILCVTFGALLLPLPQVLSLAVPISLVQTGYVVVRHFGGVKLRLLLTEVLPLMIAGGALSLWLLGDLRAPWLKQAFGALVLMLSLRELWGRLRASGTHEPTVPRWARLVAMFGAGIVHGLFATGGPLLVYALGKEKLTKGEFRSTVTAVWLVLNFALVVVYLRSGRLDASAGFASASLLPAVAAGIWAGEVLHHKVDEQRFRLFLFAVLTAAALALILR
ncbi:MAG: sulfite exporter TauE/SafE family protein [Polyangiaceae bacterium]